MSNHRLDTKHQIKILCLTSANTETSESSPTLTRVRLLLLSVFSLLQEKFTKSVKYTTVSQLLTSWNKKLSVVSQFSQLLLQHSGQCQIICASGGVEPQSETNWRYANESEVSRVIYVNKLDRIGGDFYRVVDQVKNILGATPLVMVLPIGIESDFTGLVDLLTRKAWVWDDSGQLLLSKMTSL